jgi:tetratricopeptide (TPR) repeat protein
VQRKLLLLALLIVPLLAAAVWWRMRSTPDDPLAVAREKVGTRSATPLLEQLRRERSGSAEVFFLSARQARLAGRADEARGYLDRADGLGWSGRQVERERALIAAASDFTTARPELEQRLAIHPADAEVLLTLGEGELQQGRRDLAAKYADQVLQQDPSNTRALYIRGAARHDQRRLDQACSDLEAALAAGPEPLVYPSARLVLARCLLDLGHFARALELFREARADDPDNLLALFGLGRAASYLALFDEAEEAFVDVLERRPGHVETLLALAQVVEQRGDLPRALACVEAAERGDPNRLETIARLVKLLSATGQTERAAGYEERYQALDPTRNTSTPDKSP